MANIDKISVKNTVFNIVSPAVVSDYIEVIGGACTKPDGYEEDEVILAKQNDVQLLFKATQDIAFGANIVENTNCVRTTLEEVLKNAGGGGGASSADQVSYDNSASGLEAENVQEAVDELATKARTASSQIQTLTNNVSNINTALGNEVATRAKVSVHNLLKYSLTSGTNNEVVYTVNPDKTISVSTTEATASARFTSLQADLSNLINGETYILNGCPSGGAIGTYVLYLTDGTNDYVDTGNGVQFIYDSNKTYTLRFVVYMSVNLTTPIVFKPMIRLATDESSDYEPYSMTNQELTPIAQAVSNRNLLDNPWFTVNQRGKASYNVAGYSVDRWRLSNGVTATLNADGTISLSSTVKYADFAQRLIFDEFTAKLLGKTVTLSALLSDGTVKKNTFTLPSTRPSSATTYGEFEIVSGVSLRLRVWDSSVIYSAIQVTINDTSATVTLKAIKLELGSVSTLAQDTEPNYATELLKCQRYYQRIGKGDWFKGQNTGRMWLGHQFNVDMRTIPTINVIKQAVVFYGMISDGNVVTTAITKGISEFDGSGIDYLELLVTSADTITDKSMYTADSDFLELSADL